MFPRMQWHKMVKTSWVSAQLCVFTFQTFNSTSTSTTVDKLVQTRLICWSSFQAAKSRTWEGQRWQERSKNRCNTFPVSSLLTWDLTREHLSLWTSILAPSFLRAQKALLYSQSNSHSSQLWSVRADTQITRRLRWGGGGGGGARDMEVSRSFCQQLKGAEDGGWRRVKAL